MIVNDLQRLRWQILDECLRNTEVEFFVGSAKGNNETEKQKSLLAYLNQRLRAINRSYKCSKRQLQLDIALFQRRGGRLEPRFRRGHKRILRYINLAWKNPLLKQGLIPYSNSGEPSLSLSSLSDKPGEEALVLRLYGNAREQMGQEFLSVLTTIDDPVRSIIWANRTEVEVLHPDALRQEIAHELQAMILRYAKAVNSDIVAQQLSALNQPDTPQPEEEPEPASPAMPVEEPAPAEEPEPEPMQLVIPIIGEQPAPKQSEVAAPKPAEDSAPKPAKKKPAKSAKPKDDGQLSLFDDMF